MQPDKLTPEGAKMLRFIRDYVVANPHELEMGVWECGTSACIGGHCARYLAGTTDSSPEIRKDAWTHAPMLGKVIRTLGFNGAPAMFYANFENDISIFVQSINNFLWFYGYPSGEISDSRQAQAEAQVQEGFAVPLQT